MAQCEALCEYKLFTGRVMTSPSQRLLWCIRALKAVNLECKTRCIYTLPARSINIKLKLGLARYGGGGEEDIHLCMDNR